MKHKFILLPFTAAALFAACSVLSCSPDDDIDNDWDDIINNGDNNGDGDSGGNSDSSSGTDGDSTPATAGDLTTFEIAVDTTSVLSETLTTDTGNEDYIEYSGNDFSSTVYINYNGTTASAEGTVSGVSVSISGADVTVSSTASGVNYVLSGTTTDGMFKLTSGDNDKKFRLTLNGVNISNADGPAINIQNGKRCYVVVTDGTFNSLTDGTSYADSGDEDQKATFFSEGKLLFSGSGKLRVYSNAKNGICADDYIVFRPGNDIYVKSTSSNCIKSNDGITVAGGLINCETSATASKGLKTDGYYTQSGGRVIAITSGGGEYDSDDNDVNGAAGLKADGDISISGGELLCKSTGNGGKGISTDEALTVSGGTVKVITTGTTYKYSSSLDSKAKGIKADGDMLISGGTVAVRATGDDGSEGIESKGTMTITGGTVETYAYDDAINSGSHMYLQGGYVYAYGINNDGLDSNGNLYVQGGTVVAYGASQPEGGIDANEESNYSVIVTGGTLVAVGGSNSAPSSKSTQPTIMFGGSVSSGTWLTVDSSSANILALQMGRSYSGGNSSTSFFITSPDLTQGGSYTLSTGATATGSDWHGLVSGATISSAGTSAATVSSLSLPYSSTGSSSQGGGGGMNGGFTPGGGPGH